MERNRDQAGHAEGVAAEVASVLVGNVGKVFPRSHRKIGGLGLAGGLDISSLEEVARMIQNRVETFGKLTFLK